MHVLLVPLAILAFLVFLLIVGAIALWLALALISVILFIVRIPVRLHRWRLRRKEARTERSNADRPKVLS
jgi:uncharacterized protein HemY